MAEVDELIALIRDGRHDDALTVLNAHPALANNNNAVADVLRMHGAQVTQQ